MVNKLKNKKILVVVAHPDDELLGLGATINKLITEHGCVANALILGEGITSRSNKRDVLKSKEKLSIHKKNILDASIKIGFNNVRTSNFPDNRFDSSDLLDIIKVVEQVKSKFNPDIIFTHHCGDLNVDHRLTFDSVMTAFRPLPDEKKVTIISFETPSGTEWIPSSSPKKFFPNLFCEVSKTNLQAKIDGMECYKFEKRKFPHPRSPKALKLLASYRGMTIGVEYAEAFQIIRSVV